MDIAGRSGMGPAVSLDKQVAEKIAKMQLPKSEIQIELIIYLSSFEGVY